MAGMRRACLLAALLAAPAASQETVGCFYHPFAAPSIAKPYDHGVYIYRDPDVTTWTFAGNATACQALCANAGNCSVFTFYADTRACWLQSANAQLDTLTAGEQYGAGTVAGPKVCKQVPDRCGPLAVPAAGFPDTVSEAWPTNYQPRKSVCWKADRRSLTPSFDPCGNTTIIQYLRGCDFSSGKATPKTSLAGKSCRALCDEDAECAAFEESATMCYTGIGFNCTVLPSAENATGARLSRGDIRTMFTWSQKEFVAGAVMSVGWIRHQYFANVFATSKFASIEDAKVACKQTCESYLNCEFWQLSSQTGCFIDTTDAYFQLVYPLTAQAFNGSNPEAIVAGEYIQHLCGVPVGVAPSTVTSTMSPSRATGAVAQVTLKALGLDYDAIPAEQEAPLVARYQQDVATAAGVATNLVEVTLRPDEPTAQDAQVGAPRVASTLLDARIKVPAGKTVEGVAKSVQHNSRLFESLAESTRAVLGLGSPALQPSQLLFRDAEAPLQPTPAVPATEAAVSVPWWAWLLVALGGLMVVGCIAAFALGACDERASPKSGRRRRKREPDAETPPVEVPLVGAAPAPVPTVAEPVPMYSAGPVAQPAGQPVIYVSGLQQVPVLSGGSPMAVYPAGGSQPIVMTSATPVVAAPMAALPRA